VLIITYNCRIEYLVVSSLYSNSSYSWYTYTCWNARSCEMWKF